MAATMSEVLPPIKSNRPPGNPPYKTQGEGSRDGGQHVTAAGFRTDQFAKENAASRITATNNQSYGSTQNSAQPIIDPLSRQILERKNTQRKIPQSLFMTYSTEIVPVAPDDLSGGPTSVEHMQARRIESNASNKAAKDKKKGVSFLSRIMGNKKKDGSLDQGDTESEISENRPAGPDAEVFSQPIGFIPRFPPPPKYIKAKAQNRTRRDFDRVFLAQVLLGAVSKSKSRQSSDAKIVSFDTTIPTLVHQGPAASKAIWAMESSKDGKYLAAGGQDKILRVWSVISSPEEREASEGTEMSGDDSEASMRLNAPVFNTNPFREYDGHTSSILDVSWSKNNFLLSSSMDKTVRLYHVSRPQCLCAFKHNDFVTSIQFHPRDDRFFLAGSLDSKLRLWSIPDKNVAFWAQVPDMVTAVAFTPDGKTAIAGCLNGMCIIYDTEGLKAHSQIHVRSARGRNAKGSKITGIDTITMPRDDPQGDVKLLITSNDSRVRLYNLRDRSLEIKFRGNENTCSQIHASFSDDGRYVLCGSEDRKVYIWPTGPAEKQDLEKRPVEIFEAHAAIVTSAILAPTKTRQLLAQSGDPIYDLCNPPPVTLISQTESVISSRAPTDSGGSNKDGDPSTKADNAIPPRRAQETPAYIARSAHPGGNIIITADYTGQIKIFRQDCAYQKRRQEYWDNASTLPRKILGHNGSTTTRTSRASSINNRSSISFGAKNPSRDRIINWRNSVGGGASLAGIPGEAGLRQPDRTRSVSPKKAGSFRAMLNRKGAALASSPTNPAHFPRPASSDDSNCASQSLPSVALNTESPGSPDKQLSATNDDRMAEQQSKAPLPSIQTDPDNALWLQGEQSYMYWNVSNSLAPMIKNEPRTPDAGLLSPETANPLSRKYSMVSQLSSEIATSGDASEEDEGGGESNEAGTRETRSASGDALKCSHCGNESFKAIIADGVQTLKCRRCGRVA